MLFSISYKEFAGNCKIFQSACLSPLILEYVAAAAFLSLLLKDDRGCDTIRNLKIVLTSENRRFSLNVSQIRWIIIHTKCHPCYTFPKVSQTEAVCFNDIYQTFLKSHPVTWSLLTDSASLFPCCWPYLRSVVISLNDEVQNRPSCVDQHLFITAEPKAAKAVSWN